MRRLVMFGAAALVVAPVGLALQLLALPWILRMDQRATREARSAWWR